MKDNLIYQKSTNFAIKTINIFKLLNEEKKEYIMSKQLLKSGTSIGANVREALHAQSRKDFIAKMNIAFKEAAETEYWIELLIKAEYFNDAEGKNIMNDCVELKKLLYSMVKSSKNDNKNNS